MKTKIPQVDAVLISVQVIENLTVIGINLYCNMHWHLLIESSWLAYLFTKLVFSVSLSCLPQPLLSFSCKVELSYFSRYLVAVETLTGWFTKCLLFFVLVVLFVVFHFIVVASLGCSPYIVFLTKCVLLTALEYCLPYACIVSLVMAILLRICFFFFFRIRFC